jgi:hypothetical protein
VSPLGERKAHYGITEDSLYSGMGARRGRGKNAGEDMTNAERSRPVEISGVGLGFDFHRACHPPLASGARVVVGHKGHPPQQHRGENTARVGGGLDVELLVVNPAFGPVFYWMTNVQSEVVLVTVLDSFRSSALAAESSRIAAAFFTVVVIPNGRSVTPVLNCPIHQQFIDDEVDGALLPEGARGANVSQIPQTLDHRATVVGVLEHHCMARNALRVRHEPPSLARSVEKGLEGTAQILEHRVGRRENVSQNEHFEPMGCDIERIVADLFIPLAGKGHRVLLV